MTRSGGETNQGRADGIDFFVSVFARGALARCSSARVAAAPLLPSPSFAASLFVPFFAVFLLSFNATSISRIFPCRKSGQNAKKEQRQSTRERRREILARLSPFFSTKKKARRSSLSYFVFTLSSPCVHLLSAYQRSYILPRIVVGGHCGERDRR